MKAVGIICEYNPFHNGHLYHLQKVKELFPDHLIILVLNGYFLERGEISLISKYDKTKLALTFGIDLVVELPVVFGTQSADIFADTSIKILASFQCEYVVFGSESNNLEYLKQISNYQLTLKEEYNKSVQAYLKRGLNYPTALAKACHLEEPLKANDLLGLSYLKSIKNNNFTLQPVAIQRTNDYLDTNLDTEIVSASNIRHKLKHNLDITKYVPEDTLKVLNNISLDNLFPYLKYKIITSHDLSIYLDVDEGIENRLKKVIPKCQNMTELMELTKSKRYTYNKIRRMFIHILIGLTKSDKDKLSLDYIKVLGFSKKGQLYLNTIKKDLPITTTPNKQSLTYKYELKSSQIYDLVTNNNNTNWENSNKPINL